MRIAIHPQSHWATSDGVDRLVLAGLGTLVVSAAVSLAIVGYLAAGCALLGIAVLGVVAFACTAPDTDVELSLAGGAAPDDGDPGR